MQSVGWLLIFYHRYLNIYCYMIIIMIIIILSYWKGDTQAESDILLIKTLFLIDMTSRHMS